LSQPLDVEARKQLRNILADVAIVGYGHSRLGVVPDTSPMELHIDAMTAAIQHSTLPKSEIDGVITFNSLTEPYRYHAEAVAEYIGIRPKQAITFNTGTTTNVRALIDAAQAISHRLSSAVVVACADNPRSGWGATAVARIGEGRGANHPDFEAPFGLTIASLYALIARRHSFEYGTTSEDYARVAVAMRKHAMLNPVAQMRKPITVEDVLASPMVAAPLHRFDCSLISDGGGALVMTSVARAKSLGRPYISILGLAEGHSHHHVSDAPMLTSFGMKRAGRLAFEMAGIRTKDIDLMTLYDAFTPCTIVMLEDLGFCRPGEGAAYVAAGNIELGGSCPVNPHGGLLSCAHPGRSGGMLTLLESVCQLFGEGGDRQVKDAKTALVGLEGGIMSNNAAVILARA
jgi:acetyl-CoA acetyltransferase